MRILMVIGLLLAAMTACTQSPGKLTSPVAGRQDTPVFRLSDEEWKKKLTPEQYYILREKGTESAFTGKFLFTKEKGIYKCAACGNELFSDEMKFESHCGWPSFDREIAGGKIIQTEDNSHGMHRTEITCARCGSHLGHIFEDGPTETGKRYCVNSLSLSFEPVSEKAMNNTDTLTVGGGCFWCMEAVFEELKGVRSVESGYSGGNVVNPTYKQVCSGNTGHAEAINIIYDPDQIALADLLEVFFSSHDPTSLNRQGADVGTQYRSVVFYHNEKQKDKVTEIIAALNKEKVFPDPIVTEVSPFTRFYKAEDYHQEYYELNGEEPYCKLVIKPKLDKLHKAFDQLLKSPGN